MTQIMLKGWVGLWRLYGHCHVRTIKFHWNWITLKTEEKE